MVQHFTKKGQRNPRFSNTLKQHVNLHNCKPFKENEWYEKLHIQHIQGQIKLKVTICQLLSPEALGMPDIRPFKSNKVGQVFSDQ